MAESALELRGQPFLALAYVASPLVANVIVWPTALIFEPPDPEGPLPISETITYLFMFIFVGCFLCALVEVLILTPLLLGFRRYRWRWLNGWTGALIGFALGALPAFLLIAGWSESVGDYDHGRLTGGGWLHAASLGLLFGAIGALSAIAFRLIAVRTVRSSLNKTAQVFS
jgi:hypothetical protein